MGIMMALDRRWITPLMVGSMLVSGMSGTLMFFDVANDLQEEIHEWLGIVLMSGAICHVLLNFQSLKKQLQTSRGKWIFVGFATLMELSFFGGFGGDGDYDGEDDDD